MSETMGKTITCKAAVAKGVNQPMTIETVQVAPPKAHEVRLKMVTAGVCHSDAHFIWREQPEWTFPLVLGHEGAGIVESVGEGVTCVAPGDHILTCFLPQCRDTADCPSCADPERNFCVKVGMSFMGHTMRDGTNRLSLEDGQAVRQCVGVGCFSEYVVAPDTQVVKVKKEAPLDKICVLSCGVGTGYGSAMKHAKVKPGSSCAIWGIGGIGLAAAMGCKQAGATKIIAVDINSDKKQKALEMGCTDFINPTEHEKPIQTLIQEMTGAGCDYAFECVGSVVLMATVVECCRPGGQAVIIGLPETGKTMAVDPLNFILGKSCSGCVFGGYKPTEGIPQLVDAYMDGKLDLDSLVTHTVRFEDINKGFDLLKEGKSIRTMVKF